MSPYLVHVKMAYSVEEASDLLSLSRAQVYRLIDLGEIGSVKIGKSRRITSRQLDAYVQGLEERQGPLPDQSHIRFAPRSRRTPR